eukprot:4072334-Amphidinium_carterae.2
MQWVAFVVKRGINNGNMLARMHNVTRRLTIPTIGIGAGPHCNGQAAAVSVEIHPSPALHRT